VRCNVAAAVGALVGGGVGRRRRRALTSGLSDRRESDLDAQRAADDDSVVLGGEGGELVLLGAELDEAEALGAAVGLAHDVRLDGVQAVEDGKQASIVDREWQVGDEQRRVGLDTRPLLTRLTRLTWLARLTRGAVGRCATDRARAAEASTTTAFTVLVLRRLLLLAALLLLTHGARATETSATRTTARRGLELSLTTSGNGGIAGGRRGGRTRRAGLAGGRSSGGRRAGRGGGRVGARLAHLGDLEVDLATVDLLLVEGVDHTLRLGERRHLDEAVAERARTARDDVGAHDRAVLAELGGELVLRGLERQVADEELGDVGGRGRGRGRSRRGILRSHGECGWTGRRTGGGREGGRACV